MRLALSMGEVDPGALLARMTSSQMTEWQAYFAEDPWGEERADLRAAIGHALYANAHRDPAQQQKPYRPADFMPYHRREPERPASLWARITQSFKKMRK